MLAPLALIFAVVFMGAIWRILESKRDRTRSRSCQTNLRQIWLATRQYTSDYNGKLPPVVIGGAKIQGVPSLNPNGTITGYIGTPVGWADALTIYLKSPSLYMCPAELTVNIKPSSLKYTDYWMNANLSSQVGQPLPSPASTLLIGEGNDGGDLTNATYSKTSLPPQWLTDTSSPAYRHLGGANYLMADGTVHWLKPDAVTNFGGRKDAFAIR